MVFDWETVEDCRHISAFAIGEDWDWEAAVEGLEKGYKELSSQIERGCSIYNSNSHNIRDIKGEFLE